jgi:hypothetical protein
MYYRDSDGPGRGLLWIMVALIAAAIFSQEKQIYDQKTAQRTDAEGASNGKRPASLP